MNTSIDRHMREVHSDIEFACLYTVDCGGDAHGIRRLNTLSKDDMSAIKDTIWRRKFEGYCPQGGDNFALKHSDQRVDIFVIGAGWGGAKDIGNIYRSEICEASSAYWSREQGILHPP